MGVEKFQSYLSLSWLLLCTIGVDSLMTPKWGPGQDRSWQLSLVASFDKVRSSPSQVKTNPISLIVFGQNYRTKQKRKRLENTSFVHFVQKRWGRALMGLQYMYFSFRVHLLVKIKNYHIYWSEQDSQRLRNCERERYLRKNCQRHYGPSRWLLWPVILVWCRWQPKAASYRRPPRPQERSTTDFPEPAPFPLRRHQNQIRLNFQGDVSVQTLRAKNQHNTGNSSKYNQRNAKKIKILQLAFDKCHDLVINAKERRFIKLKSKTFNFMSFLVNFNLALSKLALSKMQTWNVYHPFHREVPFSNYWTFNLFVLRRFRHVRRKNSDVKQALGQSAKLSKTKQPFFVFLSFQKGPKFKKKMSIPNRAQTAGVMSAI